jgi:hypothetical protein
MAVLFLVFCLAMLAKKKGILLINVSIVATIIGTLLGVLVRFGPDSGITKEYNLIIVIIVSTTIFV